MRKIISVGILVLSSLPALSQSRLAANGTTVGEASAKPAAEAVSASYTIRPEDTVSIAVWRQPDFSATLPVRPDGRISVPLVGDVVAAGKTPTELASDLTTALKTYIEAPRVTVAVTQISARKVFVLGEINRPGPQNMTPSMTVLEAIAAAGGPTAYANSKKMFVLRNENGKESKLPFNYKEALKGKLADQNIALKPGDTIVVP
jgi:polysaccharide export outer membrane protein